MKEAISAVLFATTWAGVFWEATGYIDRIARASTTTSRIVRAPRGRSTEWEWPDPFGAPAWTDCPL